MVTVCVYRKYVVFTNRVGKNSRYFVGVFNKTIIPLALVGYEMIDDRWLSFISYPTRSRGIIVNYTMLSKYGNCTRLLKIKNKLKIGWFLFSFVVVCICFGFCCFFFDSRLLTNRLLLQIQLGRILHILWAFSIKQLFHSRLLDMR